MSVRDDIHVEVHGNQCKIEFYTNTTNDALIVAREVLELLESKRKKLK